MRQNVKIENLKNIILARVKFHAPRLYNSEIDYAYLEKMGIKIEYPIFYFERQLTKDILKAFKLALSLCKFNLILDMKSANVFHAKTLYSIDNLMLLDKETASVKLISEIYKANINYFSSTNYKREFYENFEKIGHKTLNFSSKGLFFEDFGKILGVYYNAKEFFCGGVNHIIKLNNPQNERVSIPIEINRILPMGYYTFEKGQNYIKAKNLTKNVVYFLNFSPLIKNTSFSCVEGLENSRFARIYIMANIILEPKEHKTLYFNFSDKKLNIKNIDINKIFELSQEKLCSFFDLKISTSNYKLDDRFNRILPQKIYLAWSRFSCDSYAEDEYLKIREKFLKVQGRLFVFSKPVDIEVRSLEVYVDGKYRKVLFFKSNTPQIIAGGVKYENLSYVSEKLFKKNGEIYLSFGT